MLYVLRASVRINGNTRQKWFRGDRDGRGSCSARGTHGNQEPPSSRLSYRSAKPREYGGISAKGMAGISHVVGRKLERPDEMLNGSKATEASARSSCRELLLVCSSEAGSAGKQLPILPLLQNNYLCEVNLLGDTVFYTLQVWILRTTTRSISNQFNSPLSHLLAQPT
jgi:hypothetical protein